MCLARVEVLEALGIGTGIVEAVELEMQELWRGDVPCVGVLRVTKVYGRAWRGSRSWRQRACKPRRASHQNVLLPASESVKQ